MILSLFDLTQLQSYIFASNRLRENVGGSQLVYEGLNEWLDSEASHTAGAEVEWSGGGLAVLTTRGEDGEDARRITRTLSARTQREAPGLGMACHHEKWDGQDSTFGKTFERAHAALRSAKGLRAGDASFDGAGVVQACSTTGEAAIRSDAHLGWLGPQSAARVDAAGRANARLQGLHRLGSGLAYTTEIEMLGRTEGERSFVGVIHVDGNGIGKAMREALRDGNGRARERARELSRGLKSAGSTTVADAIAWIEKSLATLTNPKLGGFALAQDSARMTCLPLRPIVFGGDDITLVTDGRIALDVAAHLLERWYENTNRILGAPLHACAGVAIVKAHYPFHRAYDAADELCRRAKEAVRQLDWDASALDFEVIPGGAIVDLEARRVADKARRSAGGATAPSLHARPYFVVGEPKPTEPYKAWSWFRNELLGRLHSEYWREFRGQTKSLADALHDGPESTERLLARWVRFDPNRRLPGTPGLELGFVNGETPYLDALELMDLCVPRSCLAASPAPVKGPTP